MECSSGPDSGPLCLPRWTKAHPRPFLPIHSPQPSLETRNHRLLNSVTDRVSVRPINHRLLNSVTEPWKLETSGSNLLTIKLDIPSVYSTGKNLQRKPIDLSPSIRLSDNPSKSVGPTSRTRC
ncbi:unnamed protein product [Linum trigynum]|uniref:Uncharacterized protein n=1 Tax=Linum trigynum TaxID=586398 RepID=A0AAV2DK93_9ROSI